MHASQYLCEIIALLHSQTSNIIAVVASSFADQRLGKLVTTVTTMVCGGIRPHPQDQSVNWN